MEKWINRKFKFEFSENDYPHLISRLKDAVPHLHNLLGKLDPEILRLRDEGKWSIQENVGHLYDADTLFMGRLEDYLNGLDSLRPDDLSGQKTHDSDFNSQTISEILNKFQERRQVFIGKLEKLDPSIFGRSAYHPRLKKQMRLCDMLYFQAEHDDYHIKRIGELITKFAAV
jgi:uncharacterized damage-inducible protein DinB